MRPFAYRPALVPGSSCLLATGRVAPARSICLPLRSFLNVVDDGLAQSTSVAAQGSIAAGQPPRTRRFRRASFDHRVERGSVVTPTARTLVAQLEGMS